MGKTAGCIDVLARFRARGEYPALGVIIENAEEARSAADATVKKYNQNSCNPDSLQSDLS